MIKPEIRKIVTSELSSYLLPLGYRLIKVKGELIASFEKNDNDYYYDFYSHTNRYNEYQLVYGFSFGINRIVEILKEIDLHTPLSSGAKYQIGPSITGISPGRLLDPFSPDRAYKYFSTQEELLVILEEVKFFYKNTFVPFCEKYSRFVELDKLINSFDDFWIDSTEKSIPISFFHVTRLIIARLANNPNYDEVVEKNYKALEELWEKFGGVYDRNDQSKPEVFAARYLKEKY